MKKQLLSLAAGSALLLAASSSFALPTANFTVSAIIAAACTITANPTALGTYTANPRTVLSIPAGNVSVNCSAGTPYNIMFDKGGVNGTATTRSMDDGGVNLIGYVLKDVLTGLEVGDNNPLDATPVTMATLPGIVGSTVGGLIPYALTADITIGAAQPTGNYNDTIITTLTL